AGAVCHVPHRGDKAGGLRHHSRLTLHPGIDLADETAVEDFYRTVPALWASIHIAGGFAPGTVQTTPKSVLTDQIEINLVTCYLCCRSAVRALTAVPGGGRIVNVAARPALEWRSGAGMAAYTASKAAVAALTVALAEEVAKNDVLVNAVAPSILDTEANRKAMPNADHAAWPKVEDVTQTILFLASPDNKVTRGAIVPVYGHV
ncbi:MAG: SDR family oxidoreductase, partial [Bradyrhizobiaceae bacterium]|nr:SDR family oxidoreductase [Bradyrhizobiaceae bacterium]